MRQPFLAALLILFQLQLVRGQAPAPPNSAAIQVRNTVRDIAIGGKLTANMADGREYYGRLKSIEADSFSIREVDLKRDLTRRYEDVKKVRKDYGRPGFGGRRVHPRKSLIVGLIFIGALLTIVFVAVAADKS